MSLYKHMLSPMLLALAVFTMTTNPALPADANPDGKSAIQTYQGTLKTGVMAIGAETTGVTLTTGSEGVYELDLKNPKLKQSAEELNGKKVMVEGIYKPRPGVEIKERRIIDVKSLKSAD